MKIEAIGKVYSSRNDINETYWNLESVHIELNDKYPDDRNRGNMDQ